MKNFGNNSWLGVMNIIYNVHSSENIEFVSEQFLKQIKWIVPYDHALFIIPDAKNEENIKIVAFNNLDDKYLEMYIENHRRYDHASGLKIGGNSIVYRESDIIEEKVWRYSSFYTQFCEPNHIVYNLHTVLSYNNKFVGEIIFSRDDNTINAANFGENAEFVMNLLKEHLALGLHRMLKNELKDTRSEDTLKQTDLSLVEQSCMMYGLTKREAEIMQALFLDKSSQQICEELVITYNTLKKHTTNIYHKMEVNSRVQLIQQVNKMRK